MKTSVKTIIALIFFTFSTLTAQAYAADIKAGEKTAQGLCAGCHGAKGISSSNTYPHLAGQQALYIKNQLAAFKEKNRLNPMMNAVSANLADAEIENLSAYFASLPSAAASSAKPSANASALYSSCAGCHGAAGEGSGGFPKLAHQNPHYLTAQLLAYKKGSRQGGPMGVIAKNLSEKDIETLSVYLSSLTHK